MDIFIKLFEKNEWTNPPLSPLKHAQLLVAFKKQFHAVWSTIQIRLLRLLHGSLNTVLIIFNNIFFSENHLVTELKYISYIYETCIASGVRSLLYKGLHSFNCSVLCHSLLKTLQTSAPKFLIHLGERALKAITQICIP